jgi:hypothetical protein
MITQHLIDNLPKLIEAISRASCDPKEKGPVAVMMLFPNGRIVYGTYSKDAPNITSPNDVLNDLKVLEPLVESLIRNATPFVSQKGSGDLVCTLRWTITDPVNPPAQ